MVIDPIGYVSSPRAERIDDDWDSFVATITLDAERFSPDALAGLDECSRVEVLSFFDKLDPEQVPTAARHPRNNPDWPMAGIFAQRARGEVRQPPWSHELMAGYWG